MDVSKKLGVSSFTVTEGNSLTRKRKKVYIYLAYRKVI